MLDQMQVSLLVPPVSLEPLLESDLLSALLTSPDFRDGLKCGKAAFEEDVEDEETPQTEEEMISFVSQELSVTMYRRGKSLGQLFGGPPLSYLRPKVPQCAASLNQTGRLHVPRNLRGDRYCRKHPL